MSSHLHPLPTPGAGAHAAGEAAAAHAATPLCPTAPTRDGRPLAARAGGKAAKRVLGLGAAALALGTALPGPAALAAPTTHGAATNASADYSYTTLGDTADPTFNQLLGINDFGMIAGYFGSGTPAATHPNQGYRVAPYTGATFTAENFPGSQQTQVIAINDWGNTVGFYANANGANFGFLDENGAMTSVSDPMTTSNPPVNQLLGFNNQGTAVGFYNDAKGNSHAYRWARQTKKFTAIAPPGSTSATATGINDHGSVAGFFTATNGATEGFIEKSGSWTILQYPGSSNTQVLGINNAGTVVGSYAGAHKSTHGFVWSAGSFKTVDDPSGVGSTVVNGLNNLGAVVGFYTDAKGNTDGFVAYPHVAGVPTAS
jgi:hypothetical protein